MFDLLALHIPDGFLSNGIAASAWVISLTVLAVALAVSNRTLDDRQVPLLGVAAAFVFAAQMLNFPIAGGTSGHFLGAMLCALLLGPWLACLVLAVVLAAQALLFADGGITALGANVLNMGIVGALLVGGLTVWGWGRLPHTRGVLLGLAVAGSWLAVMAGAAATSLQLGLSDTVPFGTVLPAMLGVHALIGIGEAVITAAAIAAVLATRPDLLALPDVPAAAGALSTSPQGA